MKKILAILLPVLLVLAGATAWLVTRTPASPFDGEQPRTPTAELVARGAYLARAGDCVACHSLPKGRAFAGGLKMPTPMGAIYATNITPDKQTGIGAYSLADFDRALRRGVARDGHRLYPAMPYPSYAKLSDDDVRALHAYFLHGVAPVRQANRASDIPWPLNLRWPLALWNGVFAPTAPFRSDPAKDALWNRGAYLVQGAGHCGACHTPRGLAMNERGTDQGNSAYLSGALIDNWYAPSLRGDPNTGLARWSEDDIVRFLKTGRNQHGVVYGSMAEAFNNSTQFLTDPDLRAIAHYLKDLPGDPHRDGAPWQYRATADTLGVAQRTRDLGAQVYAAKCGFCHGADGRGKAPWIPPLAGTASSLAGHGQSQINITLNGSARVVAAGVPDAYRMPAYREQLTDEQVAAVVSFVRRSWGNQGGAVKPGAVKDIRRATHTAGLDVAPLPIR